MAAWVYAIAVGNGIRGAHTKSVMRLIGEALDDDDVDSVRSAIREYNNQGQSPSVIVDSTFIVFRSNSWHFLTALQKLLPA